jgi:hypothetical protein
MPKRTLEERFGEKVDCNGPTMPHMTTPCWLWTASRNEHGYGKINLGGGDGIVLAHRVAFFLHHGRWPDPCGLHHCDNPSCVRWDHLFEGTLADNNRDCAAKGRNVAQAHPERMARGEAHGSRLHPESRPRGEDVATAKLTAEKVAAIRDALATGEPQRSIANRFGVSHPAIGSIHRGKTWRT